MPTKSLQATIFGVDKATPTFEKVGRSATDLAGDMERSGDRMGNAFSKGAKMAAGALAAIGFKEFVMDTVREASNLEQNVGGVEAVFKGTAGTIKQFGDTSGQVVGLARQDYFQLATMFGSQLKNMGIAADQLAPKTNELITLGADLSAMYGGTAAEAVEAISSLLRGERDPIERYGVSIKQASITAYELAHGLDTSTTAAKTASDTQASLALLFDQTRDAQGRFGVEADTTAGQQQRLAAAFKEAQAEIGERLLPVLNDLMQVAKDDLVPVLGVVADGLGLVVDAADAVPGPVKAALVAMAGWKALQQTRVFQSFSDEMKLQTALAAANGKEIGRMGAAAAAAQARAGGLASTVGKGGALAGGIWVVSSIADAFGRLSDNSDRAEDSVNSVADALAAAGGAWDEAARKQREAQIEGMSAFGTLINAGVSYGDIMRGMTGDTDAFNALLGKIGQVGGGDLLFPVIDEMTKMHDAVTVGAEALAKQKIAYEESQRAAEAAGQGTNSFVNPTVLAERAVRDFEAGLIAEKAALEAAGGATGSAATAMGQWIRSQQRAADATNAARDAQLAQVDALADLHGSVDDVGQALFDASEAAKKTGTSLLDANGNIDMSSESARDLVEQMREYGKNSIAVADAVAIQTGSITAGRAAADSARDAFINMVTAQGYTRAEAVKLAAEMGVLQGFQINDKVFTITAVDNASAVMNRIVKMIDAMSLTGTARTAAMQWLAQHPAEAFNPLAGADLTPSIDVTPSGGGSRGGSGKSAAEKAADEAQKAAAKRADDAARAEKDRQEALARTVEGTFGQIGRSVQKPFDVAEFGIKGVESQLARSQRSLENAIAQGLDPRQADALGDKLAALGEEAQKQLGSLRLKIVTSDIDNFEASIADGVDAVQRQVEQLEKDLRAAGVDAAVRARISGLEDDLTSAMRRREDVIDDLKDAQSALNAVMDDYQQRLDSVRQSFVQFASVMSVQGTDAWGMATSVQGLINQLEDRVGVEEQFSKDMEKLRAAGLNETTWQQMMSAGPGAAAAQASSLASATDAELKKINSLTASVFGTGTKMGSLSAEWMYRSGINAAQAVVDGLIAEQEQLQDTIANLAGGVEILAASEMKKQGVSAADGVIAGLNERKPALIKAMETLGTDMTKAFKKTLDIHSPSRVMANEVGAPVVDGIIAGMKRRSPALVDTAANIRSLLSASPGGIFPGGSSAVDRRPLIAKVIFEGDGAITDAMARTARVELVEWDAARTDLERRGSTVAIR